MAPERIIIQTKEDYDNEYRKRFIYFFTVVVPILFVIIGIVFHYPWLIVIGAIILALKIFSMIRKHQKRKGKSPKITNLLIFCAIILVLALF